MTESVDIGSVLSKTSPAVRTSLERALSEGEIDASDALALIASAGDDLAALCAVADELRRRQAGDAVSYVVNRNINYTNVCVKHCRFCAFSRDLRSEQGYFLDTEEVVRRCVEASAYGATEVCLQAGLTPDTGLRHYVDLCKSIRRAVPDLHIHAFSPEEIRFVTQRSRKSIRDVLSAVKEAGVDSLPGTSAEILDDRIRRRIAPGRISTAQWINVIRTAHELGIPTTATMMFGHVETWPDRLKHLELLRSIQRDTGGFTEFVPLSFVHREAPLFAENLAPEIGSGPSGDDVRRLYAIARLMLGTSFRHIQTSWVKEGPQRAREALRSGANDLGGTLINESISTSAGAVHGQRMSPADLRALIRSAGRSPVQRTTLYREIRRFGIEPAVGEGDDEPLNGVGDAEAVFGSYGALVTNPRFAYGRGEPVPARAVG